MTLEYAIKDGTQHDLEAKKLIDLTTQGDIRHFWVEDDLLLTIDRRVYISKFGYIKQRIIKEIHDTLWAGHPGQ